MSKKIKTLISVSLLSFVFMFSFASVALAGLSIVPDAPTSRINSPNAIVDLIIKIAQWFQILVLAVAAIMIIYAGFIWMTAGGDEDKLKTARTTLIYALVGVAVVVLAFGLVELMKTLVA